MAEAPPEWQNLLTSAYADLVVAKDAKNTHPERVPELRARAVAKLDTIQEHYIQSIGEEIGAKVLHVLQAVRGKEWKSARKTLKDIVANFQPVSPATPATTIVTPHTVQARHEERILRHTAKAGHNERGNEKRPETEKVAKNPDTHTPQKTGNERGRMGEMRGEKKEELQLRTNGESTKRKNREHAREKGGELTIQQIVDATFEKYNARKGHQPIPTLDPGVMSAIYAIAPIWRTSGKAGPTVHMSPLQISAVEMAVFGLIAVATERNESITEEQIAALLQRKLKRIQEACRKLHTNYLRRSGYALKKNLQLQKVQPDAPELFPTLKNEPGGAS